MGSTLERVNRTCTRKYYCISKSSSKLGEGILFPVECSGNEELLGDIKKKDCKNTKSSSTVEKEGNNQDCNVLIESKVAVDISRRTRKKKVPRILNGFM